MCLQRPSRVLHNFRQTSYFAWVVEDQFRQVSASGHQDLLYACDKVTVRLTLKSSSMLPSCFKCLSEADWNIGILLRATIRWELGLSQSSSRWRFVFQEEKGDATSFEIVFGQLLTSGRPLLRLKEVLFWKSSIAHTRKMSCPPELGFY